ncbi:YtxH domain-containing protein [Halomicronema sp. CCY15110]|uniref:YtxH domain-containing protein n=1 Tax=Halomicronema sp. CCY15110 TaxID=2767773 RepID=UPI00194DC4B2|nr:YtxH domain-containing protein [Halomicronema sp. CCY15110]
MAENKSGAFLGGVVIGTAIGAVTGLLVAPRPGKETRQFLRKSADALPEIVEDLATSLQLQTGRLSEASQRRWEGTLGRLREAIAAGQEASQHQYEDLVAQEEQPTSDYDN